MIHTRFVCLLALAAPLCAQTVVNTVTHTGSFAGGVAYDAVTDELVVVDSTADTVTFYDRVTGAQTGQFSVPASLTIIGAAVDITTGHVWVVGESEDVVEFDRAGNQLSTFDTTPTIADASALTLDPSRGTIWVGDDSNNVVAEFSMMGVPTGNQFTPANSSDGDGLAFDPYSRTFLIGEDTGDEILVVDDTGALVASIDTGALGISPEGLAIDGATGNVFVASTAGSPDSIVELSGVLSPTPAAAVSRYGATCGARIAASAGLRDDGITSSGTRIGFASGQAPVSPYLLVVGFTQVNLPLAGLVPSPCTAYALPEASIFGLTNSDGRAGFRLVVPPGQVGFQLNFWVADFDIANFGIPSSTDGLQLIVQ